MESIVGNFKKSAEGTWTFSRSINTSDVVDSDHPDIFHSGTSVIVFFSRYERKAADGGTHVNRERQR